MLVLCPKCGEGWVVKADLGEEYFCVACDESWDDKKKLVADFEKIVGND